MLYINDGTKKNANHKKISAENLNEGEGVFSNDDDKNSKLDEQKVETITSNGRVIHGVIQDVNDVTYCFCSPVQTFPDNKTAAGIADDEPSAVFSLADGKSDDKKEVGEIDKANTWIAKKEQQNYVGGSKPLQSKKNQKSQKNK